MTLSGVNIDVSGTGDVMAMQAGKAAVEITGNRDVTIELDGTNTVQSGVWRAGVEKNTIEATETEAASGKGNLTITDENGTDGSLNATGGLFGAGIGGDYYSSTSNITITGSAKVTATGGDKASGIGGGYISSFQNTNNGGSNITVSEDAQVKVQGGVRDYRSGSYDGAGAAIGNGGTWEQDGAEVPPNTGALTPNGKIEYYVPGEDINNATPYKTVTGTYVPAQDEEKPPVDEEKPDQPAEESAAEAVYAAPLYRVVNQDGKDILHSDARQDGVLTITVDADIASLTGKLDGIQTLKAQGVDTIVFVTNGATSTFALSDLLAQTGDTYTRTHDGSTVTFTLGAVKTDISGILAKQ